MKILSVSCKSTHEIIPTESMNQGYNISFISSLALQEENTIYFKLSSRFRVITY